MSKTAVTTVIEGNWLTMGETMQRLAKSMSTVERLSGTGQLRSRLKPRPGRKPERLYSEEDVQKLESVSNTSSRALSLARTPAAPEMLTLLSRLVAPAAIPPPKLTLSYQEAAEYSGLTVGYLRKTVRDGELRAHRGRVFRASLEQFCR